MRRAFLGVRGYIDAVGRTIGAAVWKAGGSSVACPLSRDAFGC